MEWKDFLNPRSMLTPGIAGSLVMVIANTMWVEFMIPQKWTALVLSFLIIIPILMQFTVSFIENIIYFMFNGLIIFSLSVNTNFAGQKIQEITSDRTSISGAVSSPRSSPSSLVFYSREAQTKKIHGLELASNVQQNPATNGNQTSSQDSSKLKENKEPEKKETKERRRFFESWF